MRVLLVNLTRFGDLLQSQSGISALCDDGHEVALVCLDNFASATALLRGIKTVFPLHGGHLLKSMEHCENEQTSMSPSWVEGFGGLVSWRENLWRQFAPDVVINCTPFLSAKLLSRFLAKDRLVFGFGVDANGFGDNRGQWASLLQGAKGLRGASPFNVADVFRAMMLGAVDAEPLRANREGVAKEICQQSEADVDNTDRLEAFLPGALARPAEDALKAMLLHLEFMQPPEMAGDVRGYVALQLGASEKRRQWPVASFAAIGRQCWQEYGLCPVLLGSKAEKELAHSYAACTDSPFVSLCGETSLPELASALCCCKLLLTNDTGTMHLAAGLNVPVFAIFLATAQPFDTGPCLPGSYSFEPDMDCHPCAFGVACPHDNACRDAITSEIVWSFISRYLAGAPSASCITGDGAKIKTRVWRTARQTDGTLFLESFSGHGDTDRAVWFAAQQVFLGEFLAGKGAVQLNSVQLSAAGAQEARADVATILGYMTLLEKQGEVLGVRAVPAMRAKFLQSWGAVTEAICRSRWIAALGPIWMDDTQKEGQNMAQTLAIISQYRKLLGKIADALETTLQDRSE